jgi:hypothetical protein
MWFNCSGGLEPASSGLWTATVVANRETNPTAGGTNTPALTPIDHPRSGLSLSVRQSTPGPVTRLCPFNRHDSRCTESSSGCSDVNGADRSRIPRHASHGALSPLRWLPVFCNSVQQSGTLLPRALRRNIYDFTYLPTIPSFGIPLAWEKAARLVKRSKREHRTGHSNRGLLSWNHERRF